MIFRACISIENALNKILKQMDAWISKSDKTLGMGECWHRILFKILNILLNF